MPTATDDRLGAGKWSAGPAFRFAYRPGRWSLGAVVASLSSFAGSSDRAEVDQLLVRALIRHQLRGDWYFTSNPIITASWNASSRQRWLVPVGGGIGKRFEIGNMPAALAVHAYSNVIEPDGAPDFVVRINFVLPIPQRLRRP